MCRHDVAPLVLAVHDPAELSNVLVAATSFRALLPGHFPEHLAAACRSEFGEKPFFSENVAAACCSELGEKPLF